VGKDIGRLTEPLYVVDGVLIIGTRSSSWAQELTFKKAEILERLSKKLGDGVIRDLRFQSSSWKKEKEALEKKKEPVLTTAEYDLVETAILPIENEALKAIFRKLVIHGIRRAKK